MPALDLMPRSCREAIIRRSWTRRWAAVFLVVLTAMIGMRWGLSITTKARTQTLADISAKVDENLKRNKERTRLLKEIQQTQAMIDRYNRVAWPVRVSDIVGCIAQSMPDTLTLSSFAVTPRRVNASRKSGEQDKVYLVIELEGIAPDDLELARFVSALESHGLFQKVTLDFARSITIREVSARTFRMSTEIDLQKSYEFAQVDAEVVP